jgi:hypothetical protein
MKKDSLTQEKLKHLSSFITPVSDITTAVKSIPEKYLLEPNLPIGVFIQESLNIHFVAQDDREILTSRGLNWGIIDELPRRIEYLQKCEMEWWKARFSLSPETKEYFRIMDLAQATSEVLIRAFEFLADNDDNLTTAINNIKKGNDEFELVFDIQALNALCEREKTKLEAIGVAPQTFIDARYCVEHFPMAASLYDMDCSESLAQINRNQAYTFLLVAIEEVRRCARHAFWDDKKHLRVYLSEYFIRRKK